MSDGATCDVLSDFAIRLEVGLERGADPDHKAILAPGSNHQTFELRRGLNHGVPRDIIASWLKTNRRFLHCIKQQRIRIVEHRKPERRVIGASRGARTTEFVDLVR